jgi:hypothetical protein
MQKLKSKHVKAAGKAGRSQLVLRRSQLVGSAWDDALNAMRSIQTEKLIPIRHSVALRESCRVMQHEISKMLKYQPIRGEGGVADDLRRLTERLDRICELANEMECGSLAIEITRALDAAYKRMP